MKPILSLLLLKHDRLFVDFQRPPPPVIESASEYPENDNKAATSVTLVHRLRVTVLSVRFIFSGDQAAKNIGVFTPQG